MMDVPIPTESPTVLPNKKESNMNNKQKNNTLAVTVVVLGLLLLYTPAGEIPELHGSCVYAIQDWHNPEYVEYCVPLPYADEARQLEIPLTVLTPTRTVSNKATTDNKSPIVVAPTSDRPHTDKPVVEVPAVPPPASVPPPTPVCVPVPFHPCDESITEPVAPIAGRCDKGGGNGSEGCDPGNKPGNGHDDE